MTGEDTPTHKWWRVSSIACAELLAMSLWFSASAVVPQLSAEWDLSGGAVSWLTMSVQIGFVVGALVSALLTLADRIPARRLFAWSAVLGAACNAAIVLVDAPGPAILLRFLTGITLAGVYPPGMKLIATWCREDRGFGIGILVGALTVGSALPHLLTVLPLFGTTGIPPWRDVLLGTSVLAVGAAALGGTVPEGPYHSGPAPFDWHAVGRVLSNPATRLMNYGYLGHMWELYAMWVWVPAMLLASYGDAGWSPVGARMAGFAVIAIGAVGCVLAGRWADRLGRTTIVIASLLVSGSCAVAAGLFYTTPGVLTAICLLWGIAIVSDSAQFSAGVTELTEPQFIGTALTVQTSLGFLLTLATIRMVPPLEALLTWRWALAPLAAGSLFGAINMWRLRQRPEAGRLAGGRR